MFNRLLKKKEGFTLVEVIIVLAIIGLIFLIIFLAVAAAQRSQRDTGRKDGVDRTAAAVITLVGNGITTPTITQISNTVGTFPGYVTLAAAVGGACPDPMPTSTIQITSVANGGNVCVGLENGGSAGSGPRYQRTISL